MAETDDEAFHFTQEEAAVVGREPAGRGRFGHQVNMEPTPGRVQFAEAVGPDDAVRAPAAERAPNGELTELPRGYRTDGVVIVVPEKPGILIGQLMIDAGQPLPINVTDPRGGPWLDWQSNDHLCRVIDDFLAGGEKYLKLTNPVEGHTFRLTRYCLERLLMVATSRMEIKDPPVPNQTPGGIPVLRGPIDARALRL